MSFDHPVIDVNVRFLDGPNGPYHREGEGSGLGYGTQDSAGIDLRACFTEDQMTVEPGCKVTIPAGIAIEMKSPGVAAFVYSRSGLGIKEGLTVSQGVGVIDPDYRGEIKVSLLNTSHETRTVVRGQRMAQLVFQPFVRANITPVEELGDTSRGSGGFGHTGKLWGIWAIWGDLRRYCGDD